MPQCPMPSVGQWGGVGSKTCAHRYRINRDKQDELSSEDVDWVGLTPLVLGLMVKPQKGISCMQLSMPGIQQGRIRSSSRQFPYPDKALGAQVALLPMMDMICDVASPASQGLCYWVTEQRSCFSETRRTQQSGLSQTQTRSSQRHQHALP
jgi:hypothetical protein